jgi:hypothetical protein
MGVVRALLHTVPIRSSLGFLSAWSLFYVNGFFLRLKPRGVALSRLKVVFFDSRS